MEYRILGPLEVTDGARARPLGGLKQRSLLARLLLAPNRVVPTSVLIEALWGAAPPPTARQSLQNTVAALRRTLQPGHVAATSSPEGEQVLLTHDPGYLLRVEPGERDLDEFRGAVTDARRALARGEAAGAGVLLRSGLRLWRGPPLADLVAAGVDWARRLDLTEEHLAALELRVEADLVAGRHRELVADLAELVRRHPLRERFRAQHMVALYRSGRQADALTAYSAARHALVTELGIEPGAELQALQRAILTQALPAVEPGPGGPPAAPGRCALREERRLVTVLLAAVDSAAGDPEERDPEDVRADLAAAIQRTCEQIERFGGGVQQVMGATVMALFGSPQAHEDDPERAVRAALAVRDRAGGGEVPTRIAVATGEALLVPSPGRLEAAVSGAVVTAGARLLESAPGGRVIVAPATERATRRRVASRPVRLPVIAGREPPPAYEALHVRPLGPTSTRETAGDAPLRGREGELAVLDAALGEVAARREPRLVTVIGEAGIGKSRLAREFRQRQEPDAAVWHQGRSLPYGTSMAFWALAEIVKQYAGILETDPAATAEHKLARSVRSAVGAAGEREWVARHLRPLVGGEGQRPAHGGRQADAFAAWRTFVAGLGAGRPNVLVFEDVHWADDALLDFIATLPRHGGPVPLLVVVLARPALFERRPGWGAGNAWGPGGTQTLVALAPLREVDATGLVADLLARHRLPPGLAAALVARAGGNPLFAEEYVRMLADREDLRSPPEGGLPLPETVHAIIGARLDRLTAEEQAVIGDAAVVGRVGWDGAVAMVGGHEEGRLAACLQRLERRELLQRVSRSRVAGQREYRFTHVLVRDVAYARIPRAERAEKHRRAAAWIGTLPADRAVERAELLAHHYQQALEAARAAGQPTGDLARHAGTALRAAGDRAAGLSAYGAAARFYDAALALWPDDDPERPELLFRLGASRFFQEGDGEHLITRARDALLAAGSRTRAAESEVLLGHIAWRRGRDDRAAMQRALRLVEGAPPSESRAFVLSRCALRFAIDGRSAQALAIGVEALEMAERLDLPEHGAKACSAIGMARVALGDAGGLDDLERAVAMLAQANSPAAANVLINLGAMRARLGDLRGCFRAQARALQVAERFGSAAELRWLEAERVLERYWTGHETDAEALASAFIAACEDGAPHYLEPSCRVVRGRIRLRRGDLEGARDDAWRALEPALEADDAQLLDPARAFSARVALALGDRRQAGELTAALLASLRGRLLQPEIGVDAAVLLAAGGAGRVRLDRARIAASPWREATRAILTGQHHLAAGLYRRMGSVPDAAFAVAPLASR